MIANSEINKLTQSTRTENLQSDPQRLLNSPIAKQQQNQILTSAEDWIGNRPFLCMGIAMTIGVTLGCLIKRR